MSKLEYLVPGLELCKKIPAGCFEDSALVWLCIEGKIHPLNPIIPREFAWQGQETYPAPTLEEILAAINRIQFMPSLTCCRGKYDVWCEEYHDDPAPRQIFDSNNKDSAAAAALEVWIYLYKTINGQDLSDGSDKLKFTPEVCREMYDALEEVCEDCDNLSNWEDLFNIGRPDGTIMPKCPCKDCSVDKVLKKARGEE